MGRSLYSGAMWQCSWSEDQARLQALSKQSLGYLEIKQNWLGTVAHAYNPSTLGG